MRPATPWTARLLLAFALSVPTLSCGGDSTGPDSAPPVATSITIGPASPALTALGATLQLTATVRDQNGGEMASATVSWSSSNPSTVSVTPGGLITALALGNATLTASSGSASQVATASVAQVVSSVSVSPAQTTVVQGRTAQLTATALDANANPVPNASFSWGSTTTSVATVDNTGLVRGVAAGAGAITATAGSVVGQAQVTVVPPPVARVDVTPGQSSINPGGTVQLTATPRDADGNGLSGRSITWQSANPSIASVNSSGLVTGLAGGGPVAITATSEGQTGTAFVSVQQPIASVTLSGAARVKVGDTYTYTVTARLADGTVVDRPVTWGISPAGRATVTEDGRLTPLAPGAITLLISIDGGVWEADLTAYDWQALSGSGNHFLVLDADVAMTNKFGSSEYPELVFACSTTTGNFFGWIDTDFFVTASGRVTFRFDQGPFFNETWLEFDNFSALLHPGPTNLPTKNFAIAMAGARVFGFAFTEFQGPARATLFRVTGMSALLPSLLALCPSNSVIAGAPMLERSAAISEWGALRAEHAETDELSRARTARAEATVAPTGFPELEVDAAAVREIRAVRRMR